MMEKNIKKVKTGWPIPEFVKDLFVEFCAEKGLVAQEDVTGALWLWRFIPSQIREWAKAETKEQQVVKEQFWKKDFHDAMSSCILPTALSDQALNTIAEKLAKDRRLAQMIVTHAKAQSISKKRKSSRSDLSSKVQ